MMHCHNGVHEDSDMLRAFLVRCSLCDLRNSGLHELGPPLGLRHALLLHNCVQPIDHDSSLSVSAQPVRPSERSAACRWWTLRRA